MRKTISVAALLLALTCPTYAGDIQNDSPKPPANTAQEPTAQGDIQNRVADAITDAALTVLNSVLSLL